MNFTLITALAAAAVAFAIFLFRSSISKRVRLIRRSLRLRRLRRQRAERSQKELHSILLRPEVYGLMTGAWIVAMLVSFFLMGWRFDMQVGDNFGDWSFVRQAAFMIPIFWTLSSIYILRYDEGAAISGLGWAIGNAGSGPKFYPRLLFNVERLTRAVQQRQMPGDPEDIFGGDDKETLPEGKVRALRITTGEPTGSRKSPLNVQVTLEFIYFLRIQILNPILFKVQFGDIEEFWRQIRDSGDRVLTNHVSNINGAGELIKNINRLMDDLHKRFDQVCAEGGVRVVESGLSSPNLSHALAKAIRDIGIAKATAEQRKILAAAEQVEITKRGRGDASAEQALIKAINEALQGADENVLSAYLGQRVLDKPDLVLGAEGISQAMGLAGLIGRRSGNA